jgi:DNA-binding FadR family transcriptional regulator
MKTLPEKPSPLQKRVLRLLKTVAQDGRAEIGTRQIAKRLRVTRSSVQKAIILLDAKGLLEYHPGAALHGGKNRPSAFTFPANNNGTTLAPSEKRTT